MNNDQRRCKGTIINKQGSSRLYVKTYFFSRPFEISTGKFDTDENRGALQTFIGNVMADHYAGVLNFCKAFPAAKPEMKLWYANKSARKSDLKPNDVVVAPFIKDIKESFINMFVNEGKKKDYLNAINARILPYFEHNQMTFDDINIDGMTDFALTLYKKTDGEPLTWSRISKLITVIRMAIRFANDRYNWQPRQDPFWALRMIADVAAARESTRVLTYNEFQRILDNIDPWYRPIVELMVLTGMIPSEIAGLKSEAISNTSINVKTCVVNSGEKKGGKTSFRTRSILVTSSIRRVIDELLKRQRDSAYVVTMEDGKAFSADKFRNNIWTPALESAGVDYEKPYCLRHTFIAWALLAGMHPYVLYAVAGHNSKRMIYEVYGAYVDGIENDRSSIIAYQGADFVSDNRKRPN